jgi:hemerythrin
MLQKWLVNHIMKTDKDYSSFFLKVKEKAAHKGGWLSWFGIS